MPIELHVDRQAGIVHIEATGIVTAEELVDSVPRLMSHPDFRPGMAHLFDLTSAEDTDVTADELRELARVFVGHLDELQTSRLAVVAKDPVLFGVSRMYEAFANLQPVPMRVMRDRDESLEWLRLPEAEVERA